MHAESEIRIPLILGSKTYRNITDDIKPEYNGDEYGIWAKGQKSLAIYFYQLK